MNSHPPLHKIYKGVVKYFLYGIVVAASLIGCTAPQNPSITPKSVSTDSPLASRTPGPTAAPSQTAAPLISPEVPTQTRLAVTIEPAPLNCVPAPVIVPTRPARVPNTAELDENTGLHMTGHPVDIDFAAYRLRVTGLVDHPLVLTYDQLRCLPRITASPVLVCPGVFVDQASWTGVSLKAILDLAGVKKEPKMIQLVSADGYKTTLDLSDALANENYLAYELNGKTLPYLHGFPLRGVFPNKEGNKWVKWLIEIRVF